MSKPKVLHIDENHPVLIDGLEKLGFENVIAYTDSLKDLLPKLSQYQGMILRSRFPIDQKVLDAASQLKFIGRVGAGLENIDLDCARSKNIHLIAAPEGNRNAVGEHALGLLLGLMNKLRLGHEKISNGEWLREAHRGWELEGKTVGLIGYGNTGKSFAKKLSGFNRVKVLCYDIKPNLGDQYAEQVSLNVLQEQAQVLSLHIPETKETLAMINAEFIENMHFPFWFINTARGKAVVTKDLVSGLKTGKVLGAGLDVLEYESSSFQSVFNNSNPPEELRYLIQSESVLLSPHVAGWTVESHIKLAQTIVDKVKALKLT